MIDFRYHLVSIVSIFIALAVGIVLGAGPLQGSIGTQLTDQVSQLRQEKDALRSQLDDANASVSAMDDYAALVAPAALADRLRDQSVVLLVSSDTAGRFSDAVRTGLGQAGAAVTTVVTLKDSFRDPEKAADRLTVAKQAAALVGITPTDDGNTLVADVMARLLVRPKGVAGTALTDAAKALQLLEKAGLVDSSSPVPLRADLAVVLSGPIAGTGDSVEAQVATLRALTAALDTASSGVVVAGGAPTTAVGQDVTTTLVTEIRSDKQAAAAISTVDHADTRVGAGLIVLTLAQQEAGTTGHYGISSDAKADVPPAP